jgi:phage tail-like protein
MAEDPVSGFRFQVDAGDVKGFFTAVDGLGSENEASVIKTSVDGKEVQIKVPGRLNWGDVTLKRGLTSDKSAWKWRQDIIDGKVSDSRKTVTITLLDRAYAPLMTWTLLKAWPSKITAVNLSADSNDFAIEEMTLVHEGMKKDDLPSMPAIA